MLIDFLKTTSSKEDLTTTLKVIQEFKQCESSKEWFAVAFMAWIKLEQLEEYLEHLVNNQPLRDDTIKEIKKFEK